MTRTREQGPTKFFAAYKQISLIGSVPTKFTINSTTNWGLCLQAALACLPTLSGPGRTASTDLVGILRHQVAQLVPQLMFALAFLGSELLVVDDVSQLDGSFVEAIVFDEVIDEFLRILRAQLHVSPIYAQTWKRRIR